MKSSHVIHLLLLHNRRPFLGKYISSDAINWSNFALFLNVMRISFKKTVFKTGQYHKTNNDGLGDGQVNNTHGIIGH